MYQDRGPGCVGGIRERMRRWSSAHAHGSDSRDYHREWCSGGRCPSHNAGKADRQEGRHRVHRAGRRGRHRRAEQSTSLEKGLVLDSRHLRCRRGRHRSCVFVWSLQDQDHPQLRQLITRGE